MAILVDPVIDHADGIGTGNDTVPPGITGTAWAHCVSDKNLQELQDFLTNNPGINCPVENIRTPTNGSVCTYVGLDSSQRNSAIGAGALPFGAKHVIANCFDSGSTSLYEPING